MTIDVDVNGDVLRDQFEDLLSKIRRDARDSEEKAKFHKPPLKKWGEMHLLPYIDLTLVAKSLLLVPPVGGIVKVLSGRRGDTKIRQTVAKLANDLLDQTIRGEELLKRLKLMAMEE